MFPSHLGGVVDFHLCQQFSIDAEVAETASFVTDDAVALAGHRDEPGPLKMIRSLQSPQKVSCDGVDQTWTLCQSKTHRIPNKFLSQHGVRTVYFISISRLTFGSTDDQAKFCTHRHTYNFLVVACQNGSRCRVVTFKVRHTTNQNISVSYFANKHRLSHRHILGGGPFGLSCKCSHVYWWSSNDFISPHMSHDWWWPGERLVRGVSLQSNTNAD